MTWRILNIEPEGYSQEARQILEGLGELHEESVNRERLFALLPVYDVLITRLAHTIDEEVLKYAHRLKAIVTPTTGLNHVDLNVAEMRGIQVLSLRGETNFLSDITATAELTWGLLLALVRKIPKASRDVVSGSWSRDSFITHQLSQKTLGIIGLGRLGAIVAEYGKAFRMTVLAFDKIASVHHSRAELTDLETLLKESDILSIHLPYSDETHFFLDEKKINLMKQGAIVLNTSRGEIIDEEALVAALKSGKIAGVATDVLCGEAATNRDWLRGNKLYQYAMKSESVLITPHMGGATTESMASTEIFMANKLERVMKKGL